MKIGKHDLAIIIIMVCPCFVTTLVVRQEMAPLYENLNTSRIILWGSESDMTWGATSAGSVAESLLPTISMYSGTFHYLGMSLPRASDILAIPG